MNEIKINSFICSGCNKESFLKTYRFPSLCVRCSNLKRQGFNLNG